MYTKQSFINSHAIPNRRLQSLACSKQTAFWYPEDQMYKKLKKYAFKLISHST